MLKRKNIPSAEQSYLWSESGGHCQNPGCRRDLHAILKRKTVSELAHIIPASLDGPRGEDEQHLDETQRSKRDNILLLCPTCHTMIDKEPSEYPVTLLRAWKAESVSARASAFGTPRYDTRAEAQGKLISLLSKNRTVFEAYGPLEGVYDEDRAEQWATQVKRTIIPVNKQIFALLRANEHLLTATEVAVSAEFELHARQLEDRHINGDWSAKTLRFPLAIGNVFGGEIA